ncbi:MAG TPA: FAD-dependent oxidoreductase, partial [Thermoleophilaceae bacterium]|nr:FAD-dependent oxidoreductase [Thermoleophilaceae bacterium]
MPRRVVIIGAGHNGRIAGVRLAEVGHSVTVVDAAPEPGGGVRSAELTLPGFAHDTCSAFFPLAAASPAFRELELDVDWVNPDVAMVHVLDDREIALHRSLPDTAASLEASAAGAGEAWGSLIERLAPRTKLLVRAALGRFPPVRAGVRLLSALRTDAFDLAPLALASSASLGRRLFGNDDAAGWL